MPRLDRREFLQTAAGASTALLAGGAAAVAAAPKPREKLPVAAVVTVYRKQSHADVLIGKILEGYAQDGGPGPDLRLVSLYTDQVPKGDRSRPMAEKHGFRIARSIEEALTLGTGKLAVRGVLSIGEHGDYPYTPDTNQHMYPRRRFFDAIAATFEKTGEVVPVFSDKHLAYDWKDARHIYDTARRLKIPLMAGSSIPVAWRVPPLTLPRDCELTGAMALGYSGLESYGFHALEGLQCMIERRRGGESGVARVQAVTGEGIARAENDGRWSRELLDAAVATTPVPRGGRTKGIDERAVFFLLEHRDGLRSAVAMNPGLAREFAFAGSLEGQRKPAATWIQLQEDAPYGHFQYLLQAIEHMVHTGRPAYPVERTLLTTGILDAALHSHAAGGKPRETPHLAISYQAVDWPHAPGRPGEKGA